MTAQPSATRSNARLLAFLGVAVLVPVALVLGPFRDRFFAPETAALQSLVRLPSIELRGEDAARLVALADPSGELGREIAEAFDQRRHADAQVRLEKATPAPGDAGFRLVYGVAALLARNPSQARAALADAAALERAAPWPRPQVADDAAFALAQALFLLGRGDEARRELEAITSRDGPRSAEARAQLAELESIR
jgi:hypothetical protein